jgi:hypothetical protein
LEFDSEASILLISATSVVKEASGVVRLTKTLEDFLVVERPLKSFKEVHQSVRVLQDKVTHLDVGGRVSKSARTLAPTHSKSAFYSLINTWSQVVGTAGGGRFHYGKLCLCLGALPNTLFPHHERVIAIRDTQSVQQLVERVKSSRRILLLGNGGIATEFV